MPRVCRWVKVEPSVTMYCSVCTSVLSIVGSYTSESTPPATVYQTLDVVLRAVPRQSLRARSKYDIVPGPPGAATAGSPAAVLVAPAGPAAATAKESMEEGAPGGPARSPWPARACFRQSPQPTSAYLRQSPHWNLRFPHWNPLAGRKCANRSERLLGPSLRTKDTVPKLPAAGPVVSTKKFVNGGRIRRPYAVCVSRGCRSCVTELPVICHGDAGHMSRSCLP